MRGTGAVTTASDVASRAAHVAAAGQLACLLEVCAPKPGNVSPGRRFGDMGVDDFLASAAAIAGPLREAGDRPVGATILQALQATSRWTSANTNLGIVLLLVPLARAAVTHGIDDATAPMDAGTLRAALREVLAATTVADARDVYAAIRLASPGGLGRVHEQDVAAEPSCSLLAAMRLAQDHDDVAREYVTAYETTFEAGVPALRAAREDGLGWDDAVVETFVTLLARRPDTHISRRAGRESALAVSARARAVLDAGAVRTSGGRQALEDFDRALRSPDNRANPGTTADLTAAAIFAWLLCGGWHRHGRRQNPGSGGSDAAAR